MQKINNMKTTIKMQIKGIYILAQKKSRKNKKKNKRDR